MDEKGQNEPLKPEIISLLDFIQKRLAKGDRVLQLSDREAEALAAVLKDSLPGSEQHVVNPEIVDVRDKVQAKIEAPELAKNIFKKLKTWKRSVRVPMPDEWKKMPFLEGHCVAWFSSLSSSNPSPFIYVVDKDEIFLINIRAYRFIEEAGLTDEEKRFFQEAGGIERVLEKLGYKDTKDFLVGLNDYFKLTSNFLKPEGNFVYPEHERDPEGSKRFVEAFRSLADGALEQTPDEVVSNYENCSRLEREMFERIKNLKGKKLPIPEDLKDIPLNESYCFWDSGGWKANLILVDKQGITVLLYPILEENMKDEIATTREEEDVLTIHDYACNGGINRLYFPSSNGGRNFLPFALYSAGYKELPVVASDLDRLKWKAADFVKQAKGEA